MNNLRITLKAARVNKGLKACRAAKELGISTATLRVWERNPDQVRPGWRKILSMMYDMPEENIIFAKN